MKLYITIFPSIAITQVVTIENLKPLSKYLEHLKLNRIIELEKILKERGLSNSAYLKGSPWAIIPPIVERIRNGDLIIIDGTHRVFHSRHLGRKEMQVLLIENTDFNLPSVPLNWDKVRIKSCKVSRNERYVNFNPEYFRELRNAFKYLYSKYN